MLTLMGPLLLDSSASMQNPQLQSQANLRDGNLVDMLGAFTGAAINEIAKNKGKQGGSSRPPQDPNCCIQ